MIVVGLNIFVQIDFLIKRVEIFICWRYTYRSIQKGRFVGKRNTEHHRLSKSRCGEFNLNPEDFRNKITKPENQHRGYHAVLNDLTPEEAIKKLILEWFPPPSFFNPGLIKDKNLRAYYRKVWQERNREIITRFHYKCGECGHNVVEVRKISGIAEFNCEMCGQYKCYACILCQKPARIGIDEGKKLFICGRCLANFVGKSIRLPKKYREYAIKLREWYRTQFLSLS